MKVTVETPPAPVVSLAEAKAHLEVDFDDHDAQIEGFVRAATAILDGPDGYLQRALGVQVIKTVLRGFPDEPFLLPMAPVTAINDVTYIAPDGVTYHVDPDVYDLSAEGELELAYDSAWPELRDPRAPVEILYTAGYPVLPDPIRIAILIMTADLYANRDCSTEVSAGARGWVERSTERFVFWRT